MPGPDFQQQPPMEMGPGPGGPGVVSQQPPMEPQPDMELRGGEEAGCEICCGLCACQEGCC
ncbi:hypothetical protein E8E14_000090 [Neopestalotiopsis sp. 37M]|nr:hypothetical protein E8E14_000090 [Neopestalotiopsis sp. 37M]